jgi:hypothetical protein
MELDPMLAELGGCVAFVAVSVVSAWVWLSVESWLSRRKARDRQRAASRTRCRMWLAACERKRDLARLQRRAVARR